MGEQADLFAVPLLPGLRYSTELITADEEAALVAQLSALELRPFQFQGWEGKREVTSFGWRYDFNDARLSPAPPIPAFLLPLRERAAAFAGLEPEVFVHVLVTRYDEGAGIGWHRDRPAFELVVGVSLLAPCTLRFRQRTPSGFRRASLELEPRSAYLLSGEARHEWEHSIAAHAARRWSITFRSLSEKWRARHQDGGRLSHGNTSARDARR